MYKHWQLSFDGAFAKLVLKVNENAGYVPGYQLKLNSYDLGVDIELADAIQRIRFEHPQIRVVTITADQDKVFCAGANIFMLGQSSHHFKVNFCKFTNETRLAIEDASQNSGIKFLAALNGICAGGGYELAMACDEIALIDDGNSAVSLPEVPLLGVLPGTGGLTRLVDKRKVRRDLADAFCTTAEGVKGERAVAWRLVDHLVPKSEWENQTKAFATKLAQQTRPKTGPGIVLGSIEPYQYVSLKINDQKRVADLTICAPSKEEPTTAQGIHQKGDQLWALRAYRELDHAILRLRLEYPQIGVVIFRTAGEPELILKAEKALLALASGSNPDWFANEVLLHMKRVLKRVDVTSRTFVSLIEPDSAFASSLAELVFASDRSYMLGGSLHLTAMNSGPLKMGNGLTRLQSRFFDSDPSLEGPFDAAACQKLGLVSFVLDELDYEDEVRLFVEERAAMSPDALVGMEANLRFVGPETLESKIFARLSAWQNWIFTRSNATGSTGALTQYGKSERARFDFTRC